METTLPKEFFVYLLDVGKNKYGDCALCVIGDTTIMIDGAHPGDSDHILPQLTKILKKEPPFHVSLLIVTHNHRDHIGCLPALVKAEKLTADWALVSAPDLRWGKSTSTDGSTDIPLPDSFQGVLEAVMEEPLDLDASDAEIQAFLTDGVSLEPSYREMLTKLQEKGTQVVRFGQDETAPLVKQFSSVGFHLLGPTPEHLNLATRVATTKRSAITGALAKRSKTADSDSPDSIVDLYRALADIENNGIDNAGTTDGGGSSNSAINNQSIVFRLAIGKHKMLFTGDMQFGDPQSKALNDSMAALVDEIAKDGPYTFTKIAHHGSVNAWSKTFLAAVRSSLFGISTGEQSLNHPDKEVLDHLSHLAPYITWGRTDRNRCLTIRFTQDGADCTPERGELNDATPNSSSTTDEMSEDEEESEEYSPSSGSGTAPDEETPAVQAPEEFVEVSAKIPHRTTRVILTIDVQPGNQHSGATPPPRPPSTNDSPPTLNIAGGRHLRPLIFVTNENKLAAKIGQGRVDHLFRALRQKEHFIVNDIPSSPSVAVAHVVQAFHRYPKAVGVVLLGDYDVVPAERIDTLHRRLRSRLTEKTLNNDKDNFIVWSDLGYGIEDLDSMDSASTRILPVSRIPDGNGDWELLFTAIQTSGPPLRSRSGIHNHKRPFAEKVFASLPGEKKLLKSLPITLDRNYDLSGDAIYLMLHGDYEDATTFWGENHTTDFVDAMHLRHVPKCHGAIVFSGCCWGALPVDTPAIYTNRPVIPRGAKDSLALRFLRHGARAFVGPTGVHYSPLKEPFDYFGKPLHDAFWAKCTAEVPPAKALLEARMAYHKGIPHRKSDIPADSDYLTEEAIETKIFWQYTCLGLGW